MVDNVLLVGINAKFIHSNLAIRSLKANAGKYASGVEMCEYTINHRREDILAGLYERKPDVTGFSCYLWNIEHVLSVACDLKKLLPDTTVIVGGPEVSYHPEEFLRQYPYIDIVMVGEGERTFREYLQWREEDGEWEHLRRIRGLAYREQTASMDDSAGIIRTGPREGIEMDSLAFPYPDLKELEHRILYYESMRGCPFSCSYCLSSIDKSVRIKSLAKTIEELNFFLMRKVPQVKFVDRTFNCNHTYAYQVWSYIGSHDNGVTNFHFEIAGDLLQEEDLALFQSFRPGLVQFEIGVQSTNQDTIRKIRRTMDLKRLRENVARIHQGRKIHVHLDLIVGLPCEDYDSFRRSFGQVYEMKPDQLQLGFLKLLDGSYMGEKREEYGLLCSEKPPYEVLSTKWISYGELLRLKRIEEMVEVYYNSFQFTAVMAYLAGSYENAFDLYDELAQYYQEKGLQEIRHSRQQRYEILWQFCTERICRTRQQREEVRELLTYDLFCRDHVKSPPSFVRPRTEAMKQEIHRLLDAAECGTPGSVLPGEDYRGIRTKQLCHMIYMDLFTIDMDMMIETGKVEKSSPHYLLFDYKKRDPLSHSAHVVRIPQTDHS